MSKQPFTQAQFLGSFPSVEFIPKIKNSTGKEVPEIAFIGRSNVGKSSLLNHLLQNKNLARVSSTPGKTQLMNFFLIDDALCLVDLPGYGFAKVPKAVREAWAKAIDVYLHQRTQLRLFLLLIDIRRVGDASDLQLLKWSQNQNIPLLIIFTKVDKTSIRERKELMEGHQEELKKLQIYDANFSLYSIKNRQYRKLLIDKIHQILQPITLN